MSIETATAVVNISDGPSSETKSNSEEQDVP